MRELDNTKSVSMEMTLASREQMYRLFQVVAIMGIFQSYVSTRDLSSFAGFAQYDSHFKMEVIFVFGR